MQVLNKFIVMWLMIILFVFTGVCFGGGYGFTYTDSTAGNFLQVTSTSSSTATELKINVVVYSTAFMTSWPLRFSYVAAKDGSSAEFKRSINNINSAVTKDEMLALIREAPTSNIYKNGQYSALEPFLDLPVDSPASEIVDAVNNVINNPSDWFETPDPDKDTDGDGMTDAMELVLGTNPGFVNQYKNGDLSEMTVGNANVGEYMSTKVFLKCPDGSRIELDHFILDPCNPLDDNSYSNQKLSDYGAIPSGCELELETYYSDNPTLHISKDSNYTCELDLPDFVDAPPPKIDPDKSFNGSPSTKSPDTSKPTSNIAKNPNLVNDWEKKFSINPELKSSDQLSKQSDIAGAIKMAKGPISDAVKDGIDKSGLKQSIDDLNDSIPDVSDAGDISSIDADESGDQLQEQFDEFKNGVDDIHSKMSELCDTFKISYPTVGRTEVMSGTILGAKVDFDLGLFRSGIELVRRWLRFFLFISFTFSCVIIIRKGVA